VTRTERDITNKHLLFALWSGQILTMDRRMVSPRRPDREPTIEEKKEGLVPYHPQLPLVHRSILTYSKQVEGLEYVVAEPTSLESTTLVFAVGVDLFLSRFAPSGTFDMLAVCERVGGWWVGVNRWRGRREWYIGQKRECFILQRVTT
jgi:ER membrane protein complex subunit 1